MNDIPVPVIGIIVGLLFLAALSGIVLRKLRFPYTIGLVIVGILAAIASRRIEFLAPLQQVSLTPNVILYVLLPALVFEAALNLNTRLLLRNLTPILTLAAPGLLLSTVIIGVLVGWLTPLPMGPALLFGALISATDPVAVISLFKTVGAPERLKILVDGESLFNDGTAIVLFDIILGVLVAGSSIGAGLVASAGLKFIIVFAGGLLLGALIGRLMVLVLSFSRNDPLLDVAFSTVLAYASFIVAQYYMGMSGVMAVVGAGLVVSHYAQVRFTPQVRHYLENIWEYAVFLANSFIFLLLGLTEAHLLQDVRGIAHIGIYALVAIAVVTASRAVVIYALVPLLNCRNGAQPIGNGYRTIMFWGGLRGALPIGLAMSLRATKLDVAHQEMLLGFTVGVVLFTLLVQGTTIAKLMRRCKLNQKTAIEKYATLSATISAKTSAIEGLEQLHGTLPEENLSIIQQYCDERSVHQKDREAMLDNENASSLQNLILWLQCLTSINKTIAKHYNNAMISERVYLEIKTTLQQIGDDIQENQSRPETALDTKQPLLRLAKMQQRISLYILPKKHKRNMAYRRISARFESSAALLSACHTVLQQLPDLAETSRATNAEIMACKTYFEQSQTVLTQRLNELREEHPSYINQLQERAAQRMAMTIELKTVAALQHSGALPAPLADELAKKLVAPCPRMSHLNRYIEH